MTGWAQYPLEVLLSEPLRNGRSVRTSGHGFPVLRLTAMKNGSVDLRERKVGAWTKAEAEPFLVKSGDYMIARGNGTLGLVGRGALVRTTPDEVAFPDTMIRARPNRDLLTPEFLAYVWNSPAVRQQVESAARTSAGIFKVNQAVLGQVLLPVPPLAEQRRIVDILEEHLTSLDAAEANASAAAAKIEALRLADLRSLRGTADGCGKTRSLGHVATTTLGKMLDAKRQTGTSTPYLRNINVRWGSFDLSDLQTTLLTADDVKRLTLEPGDLLVCEGGEPGRCAIWREPASGIAFQKALHRLRVNDTDELRPDFAALIIEEGIRTGRWDRYFTGTTIKHLPQQKLRMIDIPLPPVAVQDELVQAAAGVESTRQRVRTQLGAIHSRGSALRRSLFSAAFSGQLTGRSSDSEVIEELADQEEAS